MRKAGSVGLLARLSLTLLGCAAPAPSDGSREQLVSVAPSSPASALTVADSTGDAFSLPMPGLSAPLLSAFFVGNSFFNQSWVAAPASVSERDGLGPLFNARSCSGCHFKDGRGRPPEAGDPLRSMLLRISAPGLLANGAPRPDPTYGDQLQTSALPGLPGEAEVDVTYEERAGHFADGQVFSLRAPRYRLRRAGYGPFARDLLLSARVAPATIGLGLLEAVPAQQLAQRSDPEDRDGDGISGRLQQLNTGTVDSSLARGSARFDIGRFGWKAEQPSVRAQIAAAFVGDMGITSQLFPRQNHSARQPACEAEPSGGEPELSQATLDSVALYMRTLAVPLARTQPVALHASGQRLFEAIACAACHVPTLRSGAVVDVPELSERDFHPFTDLLLHDLGEGLSDGRPAFSAAGSEWRTAPLWGLGLIRRVNGHCLLLHDGRARGVAEAILWHGGEAEAAKQAFVRLTRREREALVSFVESL